MPNPVYLKDSGAVGNFPLTLAGAADWGNGHDDTEAIQDLVTWAGANKRQIIVDAGYRFRTTGPIYWPPGVKVEFIGESILHSEFYADFTSETPTAAFILLGTVAAETRAYAAFKNFSMTGRRDANVSGIYCCWTGSFTQLENVYAYKFRHGFVVANDFNMKVTGCYGIENVGCGLKVGYHLDGTSAPCNNVGVHGGQWVHNGFAGVVVTECRSLSMSQYSAEGNDAYNVYLERIYGGSLTGSYMEYDPDRTAAQSAQLFIKDSKGIAVSGLSISAYDLSNAPLIQIDGSDGVVIQGLCVESSDPRAKNATAIAVTNSKQVKIHGSNIKDIARGLTMDATSEVDMDSTAFPGVAVPVTTADWTACKLNWNGATATEKTASIFGARSVITPGAAPTVLATSERQSFAVTVSASDLNSGARNKILVPSASSGGRWRILGIKTVVLTAFAGGDRAIAIADADHTWSVLLAAALATEHVHASWGDWKVPHSDPYWHELQDTKLGSNLVACFTGGSGDHTSGCMILTIDAERVA